MPQTVISGRQVKDSSIQRTDLDTGTVGQAVVAKLIQGSNVTLSSTGADSGTGDVTISVPGGGAGPPGPAGVNAFTTASAGFTVPPIGSTVTVTVADASWMVVGEMLWVDQAGGGAGQAGTMQVQSKSGNQITLLNISASGGVVGDMLKSTYDANNDGVVDNAFSAQSVPWSGVTSPPATYAPSAHQASHVTGSDPIPLVSASTAGLSHPISGNTTDFQDGTDSCQNLATAVTPTIRVIARSYNSVGNPNFELDFRTLGAGTTTTGWVQDRWRGSTNGSALAGTCQQGAGQVIIGGTSFCVSANYMRYTLTTPKASLAATDFIQFYQQVEGCRARELFGGPTSVSIVARSSVANLKFALLLQDMTASPWIIPKLCTLGSANTWTLITLQNLPIFPAGGTFGSTAGSAGYYVLLGFAAGSTYMPPSNDTWIQAGAGGYVGAVGMTQFSGQAANSTIDIGFIQHEPGSTSNALLDKDYSTNENECRRYYQKSCGCLFGLKSTEYAHIGQNRAGGTNPQPVLNIRFSPTMAKAPTMRTVGWTTGPNAIFIEGEVPVTGYSFVTIYGCGSCSTSLATASAAYADVLGQWEADTGW